MRWSSFRFIRRYFPRIPFWASPDMEHAELVLIHPEAFYRDAEDFLAGQLGGNVMASNMRDWFTILAFCEASGHRLICAKTP